MGKKTVLLTGGNGFIGKNIRESLGDAFYIISPSHEQLDLLSRDAVDGFFKGFDVDYVIHCANIGGNRKFNEEQVVEKNVRMFCNLERNSGKFERMIHFGSGAEYDKGRPLVLVPETQFGEYIPSDDYGFSKYLISRLIQNSANSENIVCLRLFGVFGKYEDYEYKFISNAVVRTLLGMPVHIRQNVLFSWLYIDDLMKIIPRFLRCTLSRNDYNIVPHITWDLVTISRIINIQLQKDFEIAVDVPGLNYSYTGDNHFFIEQIGDFRFTSIEDAIFELISYYRRNLFKIDKQVIARDAYSKNCLTRQ